MDIRELNALSDEIWGYAETGFTEVRSCEAMVRVLKNNGFDVTVGIADMPTAYVGVFGHGRPIIDFLAEYDALSGMNQTADIAEFRPITSASDNGHGCGHELLGTGSIAAAIRLKEYLEQTGREGTVKIVGCPAEETGSGKTYLAREGFFDDADVALTWHPGLYNQVSTGSSQSCYSLFFKFHGVSSHAAGAPHLGRSALDAAELTNIGVNYLREHMEDTDRVHYAYTNVGGTAPNVVQSEATLKYFVRSATNPKCERLMDRVINCANGAALMTGTTVDVEFDEGLSNTVNNFTLEHVLRDAFIRCGTPEYSEEELAYAQKFKDTFDSSLLLNDLPECKDREKLQDNIRNRPIHDFFLDLPDSDKVEMGSTDVGDVSWVVPTAQINTACFALGAGAHSWQWVAQGKSSIAHKGYQKAGEVLFEAAVYLLDHPEVIEEAWKEFRERLNGETYRCPIPADIKPHISGE